MENIVVVYSNIKSGTTGIGRVDVKVDELPLSMEAVIEIEKGITEKYGFDNVVMLNYFELRSPEEEEIIPQF